MLIHKPVVAERLEREGSQHAKVLGKTKETNVSVFVFTLVFLVVKTVSNSSKRKEGRNFP